MSEMLVWLENSPATPDTTPQRVDPFSVPAPKTRPQENPVVEPGTPFLPPTRKPTEAPAKTVPFTPGPLRTLPRPGKQNPDSPEIAPNSPHRGPNKRAPQPLRRAA